MRGASGNTIEFSSLEKTLVQKLDQISEWVKKKHDLEIEEIAEFN